MALQHRQRCEVYSRVVGYLRPVSQWNVGKKAEFAERREYDLKCASPRSRAKKSPARSACAGR